MDTCKGKEATRKGTFPLGENKYKERKSWRQRDLLGYPHG